MTTHVGPIIFGHPIARSHLETHGEVYSFRASDRTTGETWWRETRTGPKRGDVTVEQVARVRSPSDLEPYADRSGFGSVEAWVEAIEDVHGELDGYVYHVTERESE